MMTGKNELFAVISYAKAYFHGYPILIHKTSLN